MHLRALMLVGLTGTACRVGYDVESGSKTPPEAAAPQTAHSWLVSLGADRQAGPDDLRSPDDLDPAVEGLSLREALLLAAQSQGGDLVRFDPEIFPPGSPATLLIERPLPALRDRSTIIDGSGAGVVIDGGGMAEPFLEIDSNQGEVRGLTLTGFGDPVISARDVTEVTVTECRFQAPPGSAVLLVDAVRPAVAGNRVEGSGGDALHFDGVNGGAISGNVVLDASSSGIWISGGDGVVVSENHIERVGVDGITVQTSTAMEILKNAVVLESKVGVQGIVLQQVQGSHVADNFVDPGSDWMLELIDASDNIVERNLIEGGDVGIMFSGDSDRNLIIQNVVVNCDSDGVYLHAGADENTIVHNTVFGCPSGVVGELDTSTALNNLRADDGFVDPARFDFTLISGSPHIDAGEDLGLDLLPDSDDLYLGTAPDLGAVESY